MRLWNKRRTRFGSTVDADLAEGLSDSEARRPAAGTTTAIQRVMET